MPTQNMIGAGLLIAVALVLAYDVFALLKWGAGSTVSVAVWNFSKLYPIIPFAGGMLASHFWFSVC